MQEGREWLVEVAPSSLNCISKEGKLNWWVSKLPHEGDFLSFIYTCCRTSLTAHAQDLILLCGAECISFKLDTVPLPSGAMKWQMQTEISCPYKWSWRGWFNEGKKLGISIGLNLSLIFGLDAFISQQLLYLLPNSFLPRAQWGTKRGSAGSQRWSGSELHLFHFVLLCTIWSFWSVICPEGLTVSCSTAHDGRGCRLQEPWLTAQASSLSFCAYEQSRWKHLHWQTKEKNGCIHGHWDYSNWLNLEPKWKEIIILILLLPLVWHLIHEQKCSGCG